MQLQTYRKMLGIDRRHVQLREQTHGLLVHVAVATGIPNDRNRRVHQIEQLNRTFRVILLSREAVVEVEPEHAHRHEQILVKHVTNQLRHADIIVPTVFQHQITQKAKLPDCIIRRIHCLSTFFALDPHPNMRFLDHRDVVGSVADRQRPRQRHVVLDQLDHFFLLVGRDTTPHHCLATHGQRQQQVL